MANYMLRLTLALCIFGSVFSQITFTGNATKDFQFPDGDQRWITRKLVVNNNVLGRSDWMVFKGQQSGFDLQYLVLQYDWKNDILFVAFDCAAICGDADGDGNPSETTDRGDRLGDGSFPAQPDFSKVQDYHIQISQEYTTMAIWTNPPSTFQDQDSWDGYYPDIAVGDTMLEGLDEFNTFTIDSEHICWDEEHTGRVLGETDDDPACKEARAQFFNSLPEHLELAIPQLAADGYPGFRPVSAVPIPHYPNATWPDLEFKIYNFSQYGQFNFVPGQQAIRFAYHVVLGSLKDMSGEDVSMPSVLEIPCIDTDSCGVCVGLPEGDNRTCADCRYPYVPHGNWSTDQCDRCSPPELYQYKDDCGECVLWHEFNRALDACNVCFGDGTSCADCLGVPYGNATYDECNICDGGNRDMDACGVCFGDNSTCSDCAGIPWGNTPYDGCGVCGGDNRTCDDCFGVPFGGAEYDVCGVCGGSNDTCLDCAGEANGNHVYDSCGICVPADDLGRIIDGCGHCVWPEDAQEFDLCGDCGGNNSRCTDCAGEVNPPVWAHYDICGNCVPFGGIDEVFDACGICGGHNMSMDACGECFGDNSTCADCAGIPNGNTQYDLCGVCGGDNSACECYYYPNITLHAQDTWIDLRNRTVNYGRDVDLWVSSDKQRSLLRFDDIRFSVNGATEQRPTILEAKLRLFLRGEVMLAHQGWQEDDQISVHVLDNNFCEDKATWECRDFDGTGCCVQWRMLGLYPKIKADYNFDEVASLHLKPIEGHRGWVEFDVTEDIRGFMTDSFLNSRSYLIKKTCETDWGWVKFWSCDTPGKMNCPELSIRLKARCHPPSVPVEPEPEKC